MRRLISICKTDLVLQVLWTFFALFNSYLSPFGMMKLIEYVDSYDGGPVSGE